MTPLTTPSEVAAFLAENVMGWSDFRREYFIKRHGRYEGWDPWRRVEHAIEALDASTFHRVARIMLWKAWGRNRDGHYRVMLMRYRKDAVRAQEYTLPIAACCALVHALGAEVQIEEDTP